MQNLESTGIQEFAGKLNELGARRIPFLFLVDFEMRKPVALPLDALAGEKIFYNINGRTNAAPHSPGRRNIDFEKYPIAFDDYRRKFELVRRRLAYGDSYLTNLTIRTRIATPLTMTELFYLSRARYKLLFGNEFLVFSPETFIRIEQGRIFTYPMKGTIDANVPGAREKLLNDPKEMAEHVTIVDLLRNDLSAVAQNVSVTRFRYVDEIRTTHKNLLQVSTEIRGDLPKNYYANIGDILAKLLPAGSVSGAPKCKTMEIIRAAEGESRGYYTGVMGIFDGEVLDTGVMIRFMENRDGSLFYRSGGGITVQSDALREYQEALDKVYVPLD